MASLIAQLADAVTASLNADWSASFTAERLWRVNWTLEALSTLHVAVVPGNVSWVATSRQVELKRLATDIIFAKKINPDTVSEVDAVASIVEEVAEAFFDRKRNVTAGSKQFMCVTKSDGGDGSKTDPGRQLISPEDSMVNEQLLSNNRAAVFALRLGWTQLTP